MSFPERIRQLMTDFNADEIAKKTGISRAQLYRLRSGDRDTTRENIKKLSEATGVSILWLVSGEGPMYSDGTPAPAMPADPAPEFSKDELEMLNLFRNASLMQKMQVVQMLSGGAQETGGVNVSGDGNTTAGRDLNQG